jgi:hypothetical protein
VFPKTGLSITPERPSPVDHPHRTTVYCGLSALLSLQPGGMVVWTTVEALHSRPGMRTNGSFAPHPNTRYGHRLDSRSRVPGALQTTAGRFIHAPYGKMMMFKNNTEDFEVRVFFGWLRHRPGTVRDMVQPSCSCAAIRICGDAEKMRRSGEEQMRSGGDAEGLWSSGLQTTCVLHLVYFIAQSIYLHGAEGRLYEL